MGLMQAVGLDVSLVPLDHQREIIGSWYFCPFGRSKIADDAHISGAIAGNWEKFSTSNKRTSAKPHWSRYRLCAKLMNQCTGKWVAIQLQPMCRGFPPPPPRLHLPGSSS